MLNWRNIFKSWIGVLVLILVALAVAWLFTNGLPGYRIWQFKRAYEKMNEPYYNDTYGGATPEETYALFIEALKKGDVELASRYFVVEDQENWKKTFDKLQESESLTDYITEIEQNKTKWLSKSRDDDMAIFTYKYSREKAEIIELPVTDGKTQKLTLPAGTFNGEVIFSKYPSGV